MRRKQGMAFMLSFVQEYLDGEMDRLGFDLDFNHYLIKHYPRMEREDADMAEAFAFYLAEIGFDKSGNLTDAEHKKLIRQRFIEFMEAKDDGFL